METEKENKLSFTDIEIMREQGKFTTTVCGKPTFSGVYIVTLKVFHFMFINLVSYLL